MYKLYVVTGQTGETTFDFDAMRFEVIHAGRKGWRATHSKKLAEDCVEYQGGEDIIVFEGGGIFGEIREEREKQDEKWGGPSHDDGHTSHDWVAYVTRHLGKAVMWPWEREVFRKQMVRVAALAVAAVEWCDRGEEEGGDE